MIDTAWYSEHMPKKMMQTNFPHIVYSDHFESLKKCIDLIPRGANNLLDLGCGKAEISDAFPEYEYCGADLPHMIQKVSRVTRPRLKYVEFDAQVSEMDFISNFDIVIMNSFLSEIPNAEQILDKVLRRAKGYVIIHRQMIEEQEHIETYSTYGDLKTTAYTFGRKNFEKIIKQNNFKTTIEVDTLKTLRTILLDKV